MYTFRHRILYLFLSTTFMISCNQKPVQQSAASVQTIQPNEVATILQKEKALLVDVRTPEEIAAGVITGTTLFADIKAPDFETKIAALDKSKAYIVYCRSGVRSKEAAEYMRRKGFTRVYNLEGGILRWPSPLTPPQPQQ